jgi:hypothetical protein
MPTGNKSCNIRSNDVTDSESIDGFSAQQRLTYGEDGRELDDDHTFQFYGISEQSVLYLNLIHVTVKSLTGHIVAINLGPEATLGDIKERILAERGIPFCEHPNLENSQCCNHSTNLRFPDQQRLMFAGKQLFDDTTLTLKSLGIHNQAKINLVLQLRGGGHATATTHAVALFDWNGNMRVFIYRLIIYWCPNAPRRTQKVSLCHVEKLFTSMDSYI